jgi:hypothetical protein
MKHTISYFIAASALLLCLNIILLFLNKKERKDYQNLNQSLNIYSDSLSQFKNRNDILVLNTSLIFKFESEKIDENAILFDENGDPITLKQLIQKKPKLIFKYSDLNCNVCVDEQITLLKKVVTKIGSENIIIISNYNSIRELSQFVRMNQLDIKVYNMKDNRFFTIDSNLPYYFVLDESFSLKLLYIPIKGDALTVQQYFNKVGERFFYRI